MYQDFFLQVIYYEKKYYCLYNYEMRRDRNIHLQKEERTHQGYFFLQKIYHVNNNCLLNIMGETFITGGREK